MALNVNRNVQDPFYRYKMPRLVAKVEGKGNGVKTVIPNMVDIARALGRPPTYCTKYFGCELGAQTQFDFKNDRYIVNGAHDAGKLQDMLDGFIKKFILCEKCENPETVLNIKKGVIWASCRACGHAFIMDMRHKLTTFIVKNPPEQALKAHGTSLTERKDKKSKKKLESENVNGNANNTTTDADGDWGNKTNEGDLAVEEDEGEWTADFSEEAVKRRMKELTSGVKGLAMDEDMEKSESRRINIFHDYVKAQKEKAEKMPFSQSVEKDIVAEAGRLEVVNKAPIVLCELLLTSDKVVALIKENKRIFLRFTNDNQKAQKYLLGGIEKTVELRRDDLLPKVTVILNTFYDLDILEEEVILEWSKKVSKKYVCKELAEQIHKKAEPFIKWLKEADEESDEDESDVELEFDERAKISTIKEKKDEPEQSTNGKGSEDKTGEEDDDLDIDDI